MGNRLACPAVRTTKDRAELTVCKDMSSRTLTGYWWSMQDTTATLRALGHFLTKLNATLRDLAAVLLVVHVTGVELGC